MLIGTGLAARESPPRFAGAKPFTVLLVAAIGLASNPALGFLVGLVLAAGLRRGWYRPTA